MMGQNGPLKIRKICQKDARTMEMPRFRQRLPALCSRTAAARAVTSQLRASSWHMRPNGFSSTGCLYTLEDV